MWTDMIHSPGRRSAPVFAFAFLFVGRFVVGRFVPGRFDAVRFAALRGAAVFAVRGLDFPTAAVVSAIPLTVCSLMFVLQVHVRTRTTVTRAAHPSARTNLARLNAAALSLNRAAFSRSKQMPRDAVVYAHPTFTTQYTADWAAPAPCPRPPPPRERAHS